MSRATEDIGAATRRLGVGFILATAFARCGALADLAVPAEALCDADEVPVSADAVGAQNVTAAPTPSATANPPT